MLEELVKGKSERNIPITWVHGCRNESVHAFKDRLAEIAAANQVDHHIFYDDVAETGTSGYKGWVELERIKDDVIHAEAEYFICGPAPFISKHYHFLLENGVAKSAIHFEEFGPASLQLN